MKSDALIKNHFWILAAAVPAFVLLTVLLIWYEAGSAADAKTLAINDRYKKVNDAKPKGVKSIADWESQKKVLDGKRQSLWDFNWKLQTGQIDREGKPTKAPNPNPEKKLEYLFDDANLYKWPGDKNDYIKSLVGKYQQFGGDFDPTDPSKVKRLKMVTTNDEFTVFKATEQYEASYEDAAKTIAPTTFVGGSWKNALRYVSDWGVGKPTDKQIWLALEDYWVQRGLLKPIRTVNEEAAKFTMLPGPDGKVPPKLKRTFQSRVWQLDLEIPETGPYAGKAILAKLRNRTDRLQLLGVGNAMRLLIKLTPNGQPIEYRIEGEFVKSRTGQALPAGQADESELVIATPVPRLHGIPAGTEFTEIAEVVQILDERTVPIRRVNLIAPGFKDSRHSAGALKPPVWYPTAEVAATSTTPGAAGTSMPPGTSEGDSAGPRPSGPGPMGTGLTGPGASGGGTPGRTGKPEDVLDKNKNRYLETTDQVRRIPVAIVILIDQMFMQDALVQFANSPLRFQTTQYHWKRSREASGSGSTGSTGSTPGGMLPGTGASDEGPGITLPVSGGGPLGPRGAPPAPGGGEFRAPPTGPLGPMGPMGGYDPYGAGGLTGSSGTSSVGEGAVTSGLVEMTIYGIVTLYEKYQDLGDKPTTTEMVATPDPKTLDPKAAVPATPPTETPVPVPGPVPPVPPVPAPGPGTTPPTPKN